MLGKTICLIVSILFTVVGVAQGQVSITYSSQGKDHFIMTISDEWRVNVGSDVDISRLPEDKKQPTRIISAMPNNGVPLWFGMWVPVELKKIEEAKEYMDSLGLDLLTDVVVTERTFDTLNAMEVYHVSGNGKKEDEDMDFRASFFQLSQERVIVAIYIGPREATISHGEELLQMIHSLQPVIQ